MRTAIKSKAGVRTPFAGVITAIVVLLAIYALPAVFFYIPSSSLAGVIIHAVGDLITPPNVVYQFWRVSPLEVIIFFAGVFVTIFSSIESGIYTTICVSVAVLLFRVTKANGHFVGRVKIHSVIGDHLMEDKFHEASLQGDDEKEYRSIYLPLITQMERTQTSRLKPLTLVSSSIASPKASTTPMPVVTRAISSTTSLQTPDAPTLTPGLALATDHGTTPAHEQAN